MLTHVHIACSHDGVPLLEDVFGVALLEGERVRDAHRVGFRVEDLAPGEVAQGLERAARVERDHGEAAFLRAQRRRHARDAGANDRDVAVGVAGGGVAEIVREAIGEVVPVVEPHLDERLAGERGIGLAEVHLER